MSLPPIDPNLPVEERAKLEWRINPALRAEFRSEGAYTAYLRHHEAEQIKLKSNIK